MSINPIGPGAVNNSTATTALQPDKIETSFTETLEASLSKVNDLQKSAGQAVSDLAAGKDAGIHETMIAVEKADVSFQLMMQVRNKILSAYEEISRMQI
ncbi:MAG: flagellar hook-basal body complex protein FliE [Nitrospiria bacterium]